VSEHRVTYEPQPIADQWMVRCICGWSSTVSAYEFDDMAKEAQRRGEAHLANSGGAA
jgi:hypothetical protein